MRYCIFFFLGIIFQSIVNIPFRPWDGSGIYRGDKVVTKDPDALYDSCTYADVIAVNREEAFIYWHCPNTPDVPNNLRGGTNDVINIKFLRLKGT